MSAENKRSFSGRADEKVCSKAVESLVTEGQNIHRLPLSHNLISADRREQRIATILSGLGAAGISEAEAYQPISRAAESVGPEAIGAPFIIVKTREGEPTGQQHLFPNLLKRGPKEYIVLGQHPPKTS